MKKIALTATFLFAFVAGTIQAQSTTGGKSGGSTASTGAGYNSGEKVKYSASDPRSMSNNAGSSPIGSPQQREGGSQASKKATMTKTTRTVHTTKKVRKSS